MSVGGQRADAPGGSVGVVGSAAYDEAPADGAS